MSFDPEVRRLMPELDAIDRDVLLWAPPDEVWEALADPERLAAWLADDVELAELRPGAEATFRWDDGAVRHAVLEEVDAPRRLSFRWWDAGTLDEDTRVDLVLEDEDGATRLRVVESGFAALPPEARRLRGVGARSGGPLLGPALALA